MGEETKADTKQLVASLSKKWDREYLATCGYVRACLYLNLVRDFSLFVREPRSGNPYPFIRMPVDGLEASIIVMGGN